jgi:hypothetical protein
VYSIESFGFGSRPVETSVSADLIWRISYEMPSIWQLTSKPFALIALTVKLSPESGATSDGGERTSRLGKYQEQKHRAKA